MQTGGRATGAQICGMILHGNEAARQLPSTQPAQEQSNPTQGGSISMLGGLTMCELSVNDEEQQSEQNDGDRNLCDDRKDGTENWSQNEMVSGRNQ